MEYFNKSTISWLFLESRLPVGSSASTTAGAFINAIPGIIAQLILIPVIMLALGRTGLVPFGTKGHAKNEETEN